MKDVFPKLKIGRAHMWFWIVVAVLILIRLALPYIGLYTINWALANKLGTYDGHVQDFDLKLYRGAYTLQGLVIQKKESNLEPLLTIAEIDLSLAWRTLLTGKITTDLELNRMVLRLLDSDKKEKKQLGNDESGWQDALKVLVPISVESLKLQNSAVYFANNDMKTVIPVHIENIDGFAEDLQTRTRLPAESLSPFEFTGIAEDHAKLKIEGKIDALSKTPRFDIDYSLVAFHPKSINSLLLTYLPLDLTSGELSLYGETAMTKGDLEGYINIFLKDVDVIAPDQKIVSFKHLLIEIATAFANWILKSKDNKVVAAHIPFSRHGGKFDIKYGEALKSAIENKSNPMKHGFENTISLENLEKKK
jgi:hypothetical protein